MATVYHTFDNLTPDMIQSSGYPEFVRADGSNYPVSGFAFDAGTDEDIFIKFRAVNYGSGNLTIDLEWYADTASSGTCTWEAQIACITPNTDTQDIETDSLATLNYVQDTHLGTTGQRLHRATITMSNTDSIAADDYCTLRVARDANGTNAADSMTGDAILVKVTVSYSDT